MARKRRRRRNPGSPWVRFAIYGGLGWMLYRALRSSGVLGSNGDDYPYYPPERPSETRIQRPAVARIITTYAPKVRVFAPVQRTVTEMDQQAKKMTAAAKPLQQALSARRKSLSDAMARQKLGKYGMSSQETLDQFIQRRMKLQMGEQQKYLEKQKRVLEASQKALSTLNKPFTKMSLVSDLGKEKAESVIKELGTGLKKSQQRYEDAMAAAAIVVAGETGGP
jgi:hypothetical protein